MPGWGRMWEQLLNLGMDHGSWLVCARYVQNNVNLKTNQNDLYFQETIYREVHLYRLSLGVSGGVMLFVQSWELNREWVLMNDC